MGEQTLERSEACSPGLGWGFPGLGEFFHDLNERWARRQRDARSRRCVRGPAAGNGQTHPFCLLLPVGSAACPVGNGHKPQAKCFIFWQPGQLALMLCSGKSDLSGTTSFSHVFKLKITQVCRTCFCPKTLKSCTRVAQAGRAAQGVAEPRGRWASSAR